jgi:hypothetical protein
VNVTKVGLAVEGRREERGKGKKLRNGEEIEGTMKL